MLCWAYIAPCLFKIPWYDQLFIIYQTNVKTFTVTFKLQLEVETFEVVNPAFDRPRHHKNMHSFTDAQLLTVLPFPLSVGNINSNRWNKGSKMNVSDCNTNYRVCDSWQPWLQEK